MKQCENEVFLKSSGSSLLITANIEQGADYNAFPEVLTLQYLFIGNSLNQNH